MSKDQDNFRLTPDQLRLAGSLLYGQHWQTDLANALGVDPRRVREWLSGSRSIPTGLWTEIIELMQANSNALTDFADRLKINYEEIKEQIPQK